MENRIKAIFKASIIAIGVNVFLGIFKAIVGLLSHSVAVTMDAINNFTDAGSSLIAIISTAFAAKVPDKKHPFGYGRTEYLGTLLIGGLILYAGLTAAIESIQKIIHPETPDYSTVTLIIIAVAIVVKLLLTIYVGRVGKKVNSESLIASSKEAIGDVAISIATLVAALLFTFTGIAIESYLGVVISLVIIKAGFETLRDTIGDILGHGGEVELVKNVKKAIASHDKVHGAFDLILHNYGPDTYIASVHVEVEDTLPMDEFDTITRTLQKDIMDQFGVYLSAIGIYSVDTQNPEVQKIKDSVREIVLAHPIIHQLHGFYVNMEQKKMSFDLVTGFDSKDRKADFDLAVADVKKAFPEYEIDAGMDTDFNEI